jgi:DNA invertase Pin-like site-specific DNA recombinase
MSPTATAWRRRGGRGAPKASGAQIDRPGLAKQDGDVLAVVRLDQLARSTRDLLKLNALGKRGAGGAGFKSLADPWADTTTPHVD